MVAQHNCLQCMLQVPLLILAACIQNFTYVTLTGANLSFFTVSSIYETEASFAKHTQAGNACRIC